MPWRIESWSTSLARGVVASSEGESLAFDASVGTVGAFRIGEAVHVERRGARVLRVEPTERGARATYMTPEVRVEPSGLLALRLAGDELQRVEDKAFDELDIVSVVDFRTGYVENAGPALRSLIERELGRSVDELVKVEGKYPFDWEGRGHLDRLLDSLAPSLPGFSSDHPGAFFYESEARESAGLWWSIETIGLQVGGVLAARSFAAWRSAFEHATVGWPLREW